MSAKPLDHMQQAATDAHTFLENLAKDDFLKDKPTRLHRPRPKLSEAFSVTSAVLWG